MKTKPQRGVMLLFFGLIGSGLAAHLWAQAPAAPDEIGKEFVAYLSRHDYQSLNNVIARDSFNRLGEKGVRDLLSNLRLTPKRWDSQSDGNTARVTPVFEPLPVVCRAQGRFWRVDLLETASQWLHFPGGAKALERKYSYQPLHGEEARTLCAGNLKALSIALRQYAEDYDQRYPAAASWTDALRAYVVNPHVFHCPAAGKNRFGYALNENLSTQKRLPAAKSELFVVFYETAQAKANVAHDGSDFIYRHEGQAEVLLSDGTIKLISTPKTLNFKLPAPPKRKK